MRGSNKTMKSSADRRLVQRALKGRPSSVRKLVDRLTPVIQARVTRILLRRGSSRDLRQELEDFCQEVFLSLFNDEGKILKRWVPERGLSLENFAGLIAERQTISMLRSGRRNPWTEEPTAQAELNLKLGADDPEPQIEDRELLLLLLDRLRLSLKPRGLYLFQLLLVERRPIKEIAEETEMSPEALYAWRSRLSKRARALAEELLSEPGLSTRRPV